MLVEYDVFIVLPFVLSNLVFFYDVCLNLGVFALHDGGVLLSLGNFLVVRFVVFPGLVLHLVSPYR